MKTLFLFCAIAGTISSAFAGDSAAAIAKGKAFLLSRQEADGHFSEAGTPALTALPLWALTVTGDAKSDAAKRAADFVLKAQNEDGGFYTKRKPGGPGGPRGFGDRKPGGPGGPGDRKPGGPGGPGGPKGPGGRGGSGGPGGLSTYNTAVCLTALYESHLVSNEPLLKARSFLAKSQLKGDDAMAGGFGYGAAGGPRRYADLSNTAYAMDAMRRTENLEEFRTGGAKADIDWDKALSFVTHLQEKDGPQKGGAAYNDRTPQVGRMTNSTGRVRLMAYGSMSYAAVMSMAHAKLTKGDPRVRNALSYCAKNWTVDENPGMGTQGLFYYYDILSRALSAAQVSELDAENGRKIAWKRELSAKLLALQKPDGSWYNENNRFWEADPVLCTSFALIVLSLCQ